MKTQKLFTSAMIGGFMIAHLAAAALAQTADKQLFNGKNLDGWEGNPASWSVEDGCITGITKADEPLPYNQFLIWRGGTVKNFELTAKIKQSGNNSGIQYRSKELKDVGQWSIGGYQCDVHPEAANNAMLYDERGRGIVAQNGQSIIIDAAGVRWLVKEWEPVKVDVAEWNEYTVIAKGNHLTHKLNGQVTMELVDLQESERELEGLVAFQIHRGPAMKVQIKDVVLKELPEAPPEAVTIPEGAKKLERPAAGKKGKKGKDAKDSKDAKDAM